MNNNIKINLTDIQNYEFENNIKELISNSSKEYKQLVDFVKDIINIYSIDKKVNDDLLAKNFDKLLLNNNELLLKDFSLDYSNIDPIILSILNQEFQKTTFSNSDKDKILSAIKTTFAKYTNKYKNKYQDKISNIKNKLLENIINAKSQIKQTEQKPKEPAKTQKQEEPKQTEQAETPKQEGQAKPKQKPKEQAETPKQEKQTIAQTPNKTTIKNGNTTVTIVENNSSTSKISKTAIISNNLKELISNGFNKAFNSRTYPLFDKIYGALNENTILINTVGSFKSKSGIKKAIDVLSNAFSKKQLIKIFLNSLGDTIDFFTLIPMGRGIVKTIIYTGTLATKITTILAKYTLKLTVVFGKLVYGTFKAIWDISKYIAKTCVKLVKNIIYYLHPKHLFDAFKKALLSPLGLFLSGLFIRNILDFLHNAKIKSIDDFISGKWLENYENYINTIDENYEEFVYHKKAFAILSMLFGEHFSNTFFKTWVFIVGFGDGFEVAKKTDNAMTEINSGLNAVIEKIKNFGSAVKNNLPEIKDVSIKLWNWLKAIANLFWTQISNWAGIANKNDLFSLEGITAVSNKLQAEIFDVIEIAINTAKIFTQDLVNKTISFAPAVGIGALNSIIHGVLATIGKIIPFPYNLLFDAVSGLLGYGLYNLMRNEFSTLPSLKDTSIGKNRQFELAKQKTYKDFENSLKYTLHVAIPKSDAPASGKLRSLATRLSDYLKATTNSINEKTEAIKAAPKPAIATDTVDTVLANLRSQIQQLQKNGASNDSLYDTIFGNTYHIGENNTTFNSILKQLKIIQDPTKNEKDKNSEIYNTAESLIEILLNKYNSFNSKQNLAQSVYELAKTTLALPSFQTITGGKNEVSLAQLRGAFENINKEDGAKWLHVIGTYFNIEDSDNIQDKLVTAGNRVPQSLILMQQIAATRLLTLIDMLQNIQNGTETFEHFLTFYAQTQTPQYYSNLIEQIFKYNNPLQTHDYNFSKSLNEDNLSLEQFINELANNVIATGKAGSYIPLNNNLIEYATNTSYNLFLDAPVRKLSFEEKQQHLSQLLILFSDGVDISIKQRILKDALAEMQINAKEIQNIITEKQGKISEAKHKYILLKDEIDTLINELEIYYPDAAKEFREIYNEKILPVFTSINDGTPDSANDIDNGQATRDKDMP